MLAGIGRHKMRMNVVSPGLKLPLTFLRLLCGVVSAIENTTTLRLVILRELNH
jgi:hypothetical protein